VRLIPLDSGTGVEIRFDRPILLVGRHEECDILLDSRKVSRKHCLVALLGDSLVVRDLGSTNGVQVNGKSVVEARVLSGDELAIGGCRFRLEPEPIEPVSPHGTLQSLLR
jgi:pSer/pThr/pTyr-binding forkhead associated (FHA) protein